MILKKNEKPETVVRQFIGNVLKPMAIFVLLFAFATAAASEEAIGNCSSPVSFEAGAFERPMEFAVATNKGNMSTSSWISATGTFEVTTPERFRAFLEAQEYVPGQIVLHSPGGNLSAGIEVGRMIRESGLTAHIGTTQRVFESYNAPCDTWWDKVNAGICASSCAYAFLGGQERFVQSPYYPTSPNILGFHQFYGNAERGSDMLTSDQVFEIERSTLSIAQVLTGQIVLYAIEMGVDPRIVAFASSTPSDDLYYPTSAELDEMMIASGSGLRSWFMEPYGNGLVTASKPIRSDSMLEQITAFCGQDTRTASFLITMDLVTPSYPNPNDLPLNGINLTIDGLTYAIEKRALNVRYGNDKILITVPVNEILGTLIRAREVNFQLDAARVMGGFNEGRELGEIERQSIALAWRNCI